MTFDEWFVKYPLPAEIDTMDDTDREQWTWALRSAYKTGAASTREWVGLTDEQINQYDYQYRDLLYDVEKMLRENNA
jgi:hypothetical protein